VLFAVGQGAIENVAFVAIAQSFARWSLPAARFAALYSRQLPALGTLQDATSLLAPVPCDLHAPSKATTTIKANRIHAEYVSHG